MRASAIVRLAAAAFVALATVAASGPEATASDLCDGVPVWVIGNDDALSPFLMRRETARFRQVVFARFRSAFARSGLCALGEWEFREEFDLTTAIYCPEECWETWHYLDRIRRAVETSESVVPFIVFVRIYERVWHDNLDALNVSIDVFVYETATSQLVAGLGPSVNLELPLSANCSGACLRKLLPSRADEAVLPLAAETAKRILQYLEARGPAA